MKSIEFLMMWISLTSFMQWQMVGAIEMTSEMPTTVENNGITMSVIDVIISTEKSMDYLNDEGDQKEVASEVVEMPAVNEIIVESTEPSNVEAIPVQVETTMAIIEPTTTTVPIMRITEPTTVPAMAIIEPTTTTVPAMAIMEPTTTTVPAMAIIEPTTVPAMVTTMAIIEPTTVPTMATTESTTATPMATTKFTTAPPMATTTPSSRQAVLSTDSSIPMCFECGEGACKGDLNTRRTNCTRIDGRNGCFSMLTPVGKSPLRGCLKDLQEEGRKYCKEQPKLCYICYENFCNKDSPEMAGAGAGALWNLNPSFIITIIILTIRLLC